MQSKIIEASRLLREAVTPTLGPQGSQVLISSPESGPFLTKDGHTITKYFSIPDPQLNAVASIIKQAANNTLLTQGDGTTTSILLTTTLIEESLKYLQSGVITHQELTTALKYYLPVILNYIDGYSSKPTQEQLLQIATISANNDPKLGELIYDLYSQVTSSGTILIESSPAPFTHTSITNGYTIDRGYLSPYFITDEATKETIFERPLILITDSKIKSTQELVPFLEHLSRTNSPGLIIADDLDPQVLQLLIINNLRTPLKLAAIKSPSYSEMRSLLLEDLSIYTDATIFSESKGDLLTDFKPEYLGTCDKLVIREETTTFIASPNENVNQRVELIKSQIPDLQPYFQDKYSLRASNLLSLVGTIHVGAPTEAEQESTKHRVDDAVRAIKQADLHGIVPGGGTIYARASTMIQLPPLKAALQAPLRLLSIHNSPDLILDKVIHTGHELGYNALTDTFGNLVTEGVIDPTSVLKEALTVAVSTAAQLISTHHII